MLKRALAALSLTAALAACTTIDPVLVMPQDITSAETSTETLPRLRDTRNNRYEALGYSGVTEWRASQTTTNSLSRIDTRLFATVEAEGLPVLAARCTASRSDILIEIGSFPLGFPIDEPSLFCRFQERGNDINAALGLEEGEGRTFGTSREGIVRFGARTWDITSLHKIEQTKVGVPMPIGFRISRGDETLAVVDLTDIRADVTLRDDLTAEERQRAMLTAVILSAYIDPDDY
ncbi:hypothetical protein HK107_01580 [Parvularcula sp. ZS-1/3]|uniref:Lipoprotein n=1 Tax=Parvularcula mediterranea TaxID=2732508 RepID=A0A7Y3RJ34_9PROT|nr:hypothetical protein [Parvularcula mediterranea]NNU15014.1 hypothetical protein [Parvularcula mediterranea]